MKTDRLIAITMYLLNHKKVNTLVLSEKFEVSKRTILRDIDALNLAGIPIVSSYGSDGGYEIMEGFQLSKQLAAADDYQNIVAALKGLLSAYENKTVATTLDKALSSTKNAEQRIFLDFSVAREGEGMQKKLEALEQAVQTQTLLRITYSNAEQNASTRLIEPLALSFQWYSWYLLAFCTVKQDYRLFKLARIINYEPSDGEFTKEHANVEQLLKNQQQDDKRTYYSIKLLCKCSLREQVLEYLNGTILEEYENGDFLLALHVPFERMWFSLLLGFGDQVQVLEPEDVKVLLKEKAKEILSVYSK